MQIRLVYLIYNCVETLLWSQTSKCKYTWNYSTTGHIVKINHQIIFLHIEPSPSCQRSTYVNKRKKIAWSIRSCRRYETIYAEACFAFGIIEGLNQSQLAVTKSGQLGTLASRLITHGRKIEVISGILKITQRAMVKVLYIDRRSGRAVKIGNAPV